jgi:hypothetical protein
MTCNIFCYNNKVSAFNPKEKKKINLILQNMLYDTFEKTCEYLTYNNYNYKI